MAILLCWGLKICMQVKHAEIHMLCCNIFNCSQVNFLGDDSNNFVIFVTLYPILCIEVETEHRAVRATPWFNHVKTMWNYYKCNKILLILFFRFIICHAIPISYFYCNSKLKYKQTKSRRKGRAGWIYFSKKLVAKFQRQNLSYSYSCHYWRR